MAHSKTAIRSLLRCTIASKSILQPAQQSCVIVRRCFSDKFDITKITRSNRENGSLDGVKKTTSKAKKAKVNPLVSEKEETGVAIPECFTVLLDLPFYRRENKKLKIDEKKLEEFKQIIEEMNIAYLPSVSTVLKQTESPKQKEVLEKWKLRKTEELGGEEQFQEYQKGNFDKGSNLHKCIELHLKGETDIDIRPDSEGHWRSVKTALGYVSDVRMIEEVCVHPDMFYQGKFDCVAQMRHVMSVIEWKTSNRVQPLLSRTYDNPLQVVAYMAAVNRSGRLKQYDIPDIRNGALVFAYPTGEPATVHIMSEHTCKRYWSQWLERLYTYWSMQYQASVSV